jgi:serpin B
MHISFTQDADFSGMNGDEGLFVEKIIHKAFIELNEEGTEAAGASSVHIIPSDESNSIMFNADHPFIFLIQHEESGTILFIGKFCDPTI